jgi:hypothetical protein
MNIITGEKIQEQCDLYLGHPGDFEFNPRIFKQTEKCMNLDSIPSNWNNPRTLFVYGCRLFDFLTIIDRLENEFILVSHNSDENITDKYRPLLEHPKLLFWHAQNVMFDHPKLGCIPIGIANSIFLHGNLDGLNRAMNVKPPKSRDIYFSFDFNTNRLERVGCTYAISEKGLLFGPHLEFSKYLNHLATYKYAISPPGNGVDCHRIWECLYLGVIPILKRSVFTEKLAKKFHCVLLDNWSDLNIKALLKSYTGPTFYEDLTIDHLNLKNTVNYF